MVKIELISDGVGNVFMFVNSEPLDQFFCGRDIPTDLRQLLEEYLCKYKPTKAEDE